MVDKKIVTVLIFALFNTALLIAKNDKDTGIFVSGTGRVFASPDTVNIQIGMEVIASTLKQGTKQSNDTMTKIIEKIKSLGVIDKDIQTSSYNISTITDESSKKRPTKISGYRINNRVTINVREINSLGDILDAVTQEGANDIYGISFDIDDKNPYQKEARELAIKDAQEKAQQCAHVAGIVLGKVLSINDGATSRGSDVCVGVRAMLASSVPIEAGQLEIVAHVAMRFSIDQK